MLDYPLVCKRLDRWGALPLLTLARETRLSKSAAILYVRAIVGRKAIIRVKRVTRSMAYWHNDSITLACDERRTVSLASVLHESAHIIDRRKGTLRDGRHGESFCRTYMRLLRDVLV